MAVVTVIGAGAYIGAEIQFALGSGSDTFVKFGVYATPISTPTTPRAPRAKYGALWNIPDNTRPLLITKPNPVNNPIYTWLDEDDLVMCGATVEFMRRRVPVVSVSAQPKKRWWRRP